jgi:hypothetical protein
MFLSLHLGCPSYTRTQNEGRYRFVGDLYFISKIRETRSTETSLNKVKARFTLPYDSENIDENSACNTSQKISPSP